MVQQVYISTEDTLQQQGRDYCLQQGFLHSFSTEPKITEREGDNSHG